MVARRFREVLASDRFWVMMATLTARASSFVVGMIITRLHGTAVFGVYAATLNVAASSVAPLAPVLQNNAAMMSLHRTTSDERQNLTRVHLPVLAFFLVLGMIVFSLLAPHSGLPNLWRFEGLMAWVVAACVAFFQLQNAISQGLLQGVGDFIRPAKGMIALSLGVLVLAWPMIWIGDLIGAYGVLALNSLLPPLLLLWMYLFPVRPATVSSRVLTQSPTLSHVVLALWRSLPSVVTALFSTALGWICLVYLPNRMHGADGLGWVSLGVQWGSLMLVPCSSWSGLTMKHLLDALDLKDEHQLKATVLKLMMQNGGITLLTGVGVLAASPLLAYMYKVDASILRSVLAVTAIYAITASLTTVYERLFFCVHKQYEWMWLAVVSSLIQVAVTYWVLPSSVMGVAIGWSAGSIFQLVIAAGWVWLMFPAKK